VGATGRKAFVRLAGDLILFRGGVIFHFVGVTRICDNRLRAALLRGDPRLPERLERRTWASAWRCPWLCCSWRGRRSCGAGGKDRGLFELDMPRKFPCTSDGPHIRHAALSLARDRVRPPGAARIAVSRFRRLSPQFNAKTPADPGRLARGKAVGATSWAHRQHGFFAGSARRSCSRSVSLKNGYSVEAIPQFQGVITGVFPHHDFEPRVPGGDSAIILPGEAARSQRMAYFGGSEGRQLIGGSDRAGDGGNLPEMGHRAGALAFLAVGAVIRTGSLQLVVRARAKWYSRFWAAQGIAKRTVGFPCVSYAVCASLRPKAPPGRLSQ
jgi:hypothetical protein